jgi:hypothetical protein
MGRGLSLESDFLCAAGLPNVHPLLCGVDAALSSNWSSTAPRTGSTFPSSSCVARLDANIVNT